MDPVQLTIVVVSLILTILIVVLGIQVLFILQEVRKSFEKMNVMLDDATKVSGAVSDGVASMSGFVNGIKTGLSMITTLTKKKDE